MYTKDSREVQDLLNKGYSVFTLTGKFPAPTGFTGYDGQVSTYDHFGSCGNTNAAAWLYDTFAFDIDTDTAAEHKANNDKLADIWRDFVQTFNIEPVVTGANTNNAAGIYHFQYDYDVTEDDVKQFNKVDGIDIIRRGHRYAVIMGKHPNGNDYRQALPAKDKLPVFTRPMLEWLHDKLCYKAPIGWTATTDWQTQGQCAAVSNIVDSFEPSNNRHGSFVGVTYRLACMGSAGHQGVAAAIDSLRERWADYPDKNPAEYERMLNIRSLPKQAPAQCNGTNCKATLATATTKALFKQQHPHFASRQTDTTVNEYLVWEVQDGTNAWTQKTKVQLKGMLNSFVAPRQLNETLNALEGDAANNPVPVVPNGLLPCANGIVNLATGQFTPHNKDVPCVPSKVVYDPQATAPRFANELLPSLAPDNETRQWFLSFIKYVLRGGNEFEKFLVMLGTEGSGKNTTSDIITEVLGQAFVAMMNSQQLGGTPVDASRPNPALAQLEGKRLFYVDELDEKLAMLNTAMVKQVTGKSDLTARQLYGPQITFKSQGVLLITTNRKPNFRDDAEGIKRRVIMFHVPDRKGAIDYTLKSDIVNNELSGILNMVLAAPDWDGTLPPVVQATTDQYCQEMDPINAWIQQCLEPVDNRIDGTTLSGLHQEFELWSQAHRGGQALGLRAFKENLELKGFTFRDTRNASNVANYRVVVTQIKEGN